MTVANIPGEFEAKLLAAGEGTLRAIARLEEIGTYRLIPCGTVRLHSLYLDTPDLALARQGIALRLRRSRRRWEATIKWEGTSQGELHDRPELSVPLHRRPRFPFETKEPQLRRQLAARVAGRTLGIVLVTDIRRTLLHAVPAAAPSDAAPLAEICLDRVYLHGEEAGGPESRYSEVEVEQLDGQREDVRQIASSLRHAFNLVPSTDSKLSRGLAMFQPLESLVVPRGGLVAEDTVDSAVRKVAWRQLCKLRRHDAGTRLGDDPEELHDMRVATRRLRAALATFRDGLTPRLSSYLRAELKWLRQCLGNVRDIDVQLQRVAEFGASTPAGLRASLEKYSFDLERRRVEQRRELLAVLDSQRYFTLLVRLEKFAIGAGPARRKVALRPVRGLVAKEIERTHRRVRKQGRRVHAEPTPEGLHRLRTRAKRLRYTLELCRDLTGREGSKAIRRLAKVQDLLGTFHDAVVAAEFVRRYVEGPGKRTSSAALITLGAFLGQELRRAEDMRREFARTWKRFERRRTKREFEAIIRRLRKGEPVESVSRRDAPVESFSPGATPTSRVSDTTEAVGQANTGPAGVEMRQPDERRPPAKRSVVESRTDEPRAAAAGYREP